MSDRDKEVRYYTRVLQDALDAISKRQDEINNASLETRKEICRQIFDNAMDSMEENNNRYSQQIIQKKKELMMLYFERYMERDWILSQVTQGRAGQQLRVRLKEVEEELHKLQHDISE